MSGTWVTGRPSAPEPGVLTWIRVEDVEMTLKSIVAAGGEVVSPPAPQGEDEAIATFGDPAGNTLGIFHDQGRPALPSTAVTGIQPELWVERAAAAVAFYEAAFGATVLHRVGEGDDIVAQLAVGEATFWVAAAGPRLKRFSPQAIGGATSRTLLVADDPDAVLGQAVGAGATEASPVADEHGWRLGRIVDPFGHEWEIGTPLGAWPPS